jgi:hypothetical protein
MGFVGQRPAVVYTTLAPFVDDLVDTETDVLLAVTSGAAGTQRYEAKLRGLEPLDRLNWLDPIIFDDETGEEEAIQQILEQARGYDRVFLALKGGMGRWAERLLLTIVREQSFPEFFLILSDGRKTFSMDRRGKKVKSQQLASLGLQRHLDLHSLVLEAEKVDDKMAIKGVLSHDRAHGKNDLPFLMLLEYRGFLYAAFDTSEWMDGDPAVKYQKEFRRLMEQCRNLTLETGRILLVVHGNKSQSSTLRQRCEEQGVAVVVIEGINMAGVEQIQKALLHMAKKPHPGNDYKGKDAHLHDIIRKHTCQFKTGTLAMAVSGLDSFAHLLAVHSHNPQNLFAFYDDSTTGTAEAARRLKKIVQSHVPPYAGRALLTKTDHTGAGIIADIQKLREKSSDPWDFNLSPGTKEQAFMFILASHPQDRFWYFDTEGEYVQQIESEDKIPQHYPPLTDIACQLGGELKSRGHTLVQGSLSSAALDFVKEVFVTLGNSEFKGSLSAEAGKCSPSNDPRPVFCRKDQLTIRCSNKTFDLKQFFPWFTSQDGEGNCDDNLWLEPMVAASLLAAGADELVCNLQWAWEGKRQHKDFFRDEQDVVARFGNKIVVVSCKTGLGKEKKDRHFWEVDYMANRFFGRFAIPIVAVPILVEAASELRHGETIKGEDGERILDGCRTRLLGANRLAAPESLKSWLLKRG